MKTNKVVVIKKPTMLEELLVRYSTTSQARFYLEMSGHSYKDYENADKTYKEGLKKTLSKIPKTLRSQVINKGDLATFQFTDKDLVVVVGDPGLFVNVAKYVDEQPIISINPDVNRFESILSSGTLEDFPRLFENTLEGRAVMEPLTMAQAELNNGQKIKALNDLFIGRRNHVSARYTAKYKGNTERQSSSGIIVSTGTGSTGWMTSIIIGANSISSNNNSLNQDVPFPRDSDYLLFAVREPFPSKITGTQLIYGKINENIPLEIESNMPEGGVIFSDGIEEDYIEFTSGRTTIIKPSNNKVYLVKNEKENEK